jgi:RNA polymerase sigma-70 factor (sigma-E family)
VVERPKHLRAPRPEESRVWYLKKPDPQATFSAAQRVESSDGERATSDGESAAVVSRRRARDEFDRFVAETVDGLLRAAFLIVWDAAEAEDLVQECYFRVAKRWPRVRTMDHPRAYARSVLVNLALDASGPRRRARTELGAAVGAETDVLAQHQDEAAVLLFGRVEAGTDLLRALGNLAPRQRAALVLRYFEDLPEAQVAEAMGCSVGTVKSTTARALERLRADTGLHDGTSELNRNHPSTNELSTSDRRATR